MKNPPNLLPNFRGSWPERSRNVCGQGNGLSNPAGKPPGHSLPSWVSVKNCCWWGGEGQYCSENLIASCQTLQKAEGSTSHVTSCSGHGFDLNSYLGLDTFARETNWGFLSLMRIQGVLDCSLVFLNNAWIIAILQLEVKSGHLCQHRIHYYHNLYEKYLDKGCYSF